MKWFRRMASPVKKKLRTFLEDVGAIITARQRATAARASTTAPEFTPLDFLDTRERSLSRILAWLLDPGGSHAQGAAFLIAFTEWLCLDDQWRQQADKGRVMLEAPINASGRGGFIDVLIRLPGRMLAIENKPKAVDQPGQVSRYLADLASRRLDAYCLIYLSGSGGGPSEQSIRRDEMAQATLAGTLQLRTFAELPDWLSVCEQRCRAPSVSHMLQGTSKFITREYAGVSDIMEAEEIAKTARSSSDRLEAALATIEAEATIKGAIIADLVSGVKQGASHRRGWGLVRHDLGPTRWSALAVRLSAKGTIGFGVCFDMTDHRWLFYGVTSLDGRPLPRGAKPLLQNLIGSKSSSGTWPVWKQVGPNDRFFPMPKEVGREFWHAAQDGLMARMIIDFAVEAEAALKGAKLLTAVRGRVAEAG